MKPLIILTAVVLVLNGCGYTEEKKAVVLLTDFGTKDGAVAAMKGVIYSTAPGMAIHDLTHEIPAYNTWEAAYRLYQAAPYWPAGTVFVSVVDPGVGGSRKSIVLQTKTGHTFVSPDNGTLTLVARHMGVAAVYAVDEAAQRLPGSGGSYTFFGRDLYAYLGARLAAGEITAAGCGTVMKEAITTIPYQQAEATNGVIKGNIPVLDVQYGNVWTNIPDSLVYRSGFKLKDTLQISIMHGYSVKAVLNAPLVHTFTDVAPGRSLAYFNSLMQLSLAINTGNFAQTYGAGSGAEWSVRIALAP